MKQIAKKLTGNLNKKLIFYRMKKISKGTEE